MIVELRDKMGVEPDEEPGEIDPGMPQEERRTVDDAVEALLNLGYRKKEAEKAVAKAARQGSTDLESLIRASLAILSS